LKPKSATKATIRRNNNGWKDEKRFWEEKLKPKWNLSWVVVPWWKA
jgi:hypothetical protein